MAGDDVVAVDLLLHQPLDRIPIRDFLRICLLKTYTICLYCNHARKISVDGNSLALHLIGTHRFVATVDSITAEELLPDTIVQRIKSSLDELNAIYFNLDSYDSADKEFTIPYEKQYECFQCRFQSRVHKDLYLHNRKMHLKSMIMCLMCKSNFYSYSELVCHMCPGNNIIHHHDQQHQFRNFLSLQVVTRSWYHSNWSFVVFYAIWTIFHQLFDWWFTCVRSILLAMFAWKNATIKVNYRHTCGSTNCIICVIGAALRTATNQTLRSICFGNTELKACSANDVYTKSGRTFITSVYHRRHSIVKRVACHLRRQWHWKFINVSIRTTKLHIRARRMDVTKSSYHAACCWNTLADIICRLRKSSRKILSLKRRK